jgi:hypothetical protein
MVHIDLRVEAAATHPRCAGSVFQKGSDDVDVPARGRFTCSVREKIFEGGAFLERLDAFKKKV